MGLITKEVEVNVSSSSRKHFEELGYNIPYEYINYKRVVPHGTTITVDVKDLTDGSNVLIKAQCDCCGSIHELLYSKYMKNIKHNKGHYFCSNKKEHSQINAAKSLMSLKKELTDYLKYHNSFPRYNEFTESNTFSVSYSQAQAICKLNETTLNDVMADIDCFKLSKPNTRHYNDYLHRLKACIKENPDFGMNLDKFLHKNKYGLPNIRWFIEQCPDKSVCNIDSFKKWAGIFTNWMDKKTCEKQILRMSKTYNRPLMYDDFRNKEYGKPTITMINAYWGSLNKMKEELGLEIIQESMMDKQLDKDTLLSVCKTIVDDIVSYHDGFMTTRYIDDNPKYPAYTTLDSACKNFLGQSFVKYMSSFGVRSGKQGNGIIYDFVDGERTTSQYEYMFSKFLRNYGLKYNTDYFRDVDYSTFIDDYDGNMNCDYVIHYLGKTIYVEIAGIIEAYKLWYYDNKPITYSRSKENYSKKLHHKEKMLNAQGLLYFILFPCDLTIDNFIAVLEDSSLELRHKIEGFMKNNIDWIKVRQIGELKYTDKINQGRYMIDYGEAV